MESISEKGPKAPAKLGVVTPGMKEEMERQKRLQSNVVDPKERMLRFRQNIRQGSEYFYSDADQGKLSRAIDAATRAGAAIMLGRTQDGGAFSVVVLDGKEKVKEYPHDADDLNDLLDGIIATYSEE